MKKVLCGIAALLVIISAACVKAEDRAKASLVVAIMIASQTDMISEPSGAELVAICHN